MSIATIHNNGRLPANRVKSIPQARKAQRTLAGSEKREPIARVDQLVDAMMEDYQVTLAIRTMEAQCGSIPVTFSVEDGGDSRTAGLVSKLEDLWHQHFDSMLKAIRYGRVAYEKVWENTADGYTSIQQLDELPYRMSEYRIGDNGRFEGIKLTGKTQSETLLPHESWWLAIDATATEPHGRSRLLGAPRKTWNQRNKTIGDRERFVTRYALGWILTRSEETVEDEETGDTIDKRNAMLDGVDTMRGGGAMALSTAKDDGGDYLEQVEVLDFPDKGTPINATLNEQDAEQIRAFGFSEKVVTEGDAVGSFAMVKEQKGLLFAVCLGILRQITQSFERYVVAPVMAANYETPPVVRVLTPNLTDQIDEFLVQLVTSMLTAPQLSPLILSGAVDVVQVLETIGVPVTENAAELIAAALEQARTVQAQPAALPRQMGLANALPPDVRVPSREEVERAALAELDGLYAALNRATLALRAGEGSEDDVLRISREIDELQVDAAVASRVSGMVSPWAPELTDAPGPAPEVAHFAIAGVHDPNAVEGGPFRFPWIEQAQAFLREKGVLMHGDLEGMTQEERRRVFSAPGVDSVDRLARLKAIIEESIGAGETLSDFRTRIEPEVSLQRHQSETLYRTNVHQSYVEGQERALEKPEVGEQFPYVLYQATMDTSVRPEHAELDGMVVKRGTREHAILKSALHDWNCRCTLIPVTRQKAEQFGINSMADIPSDVLKAYG